MTVADVPSLLPYFARVSRRLARGADADDLLGVAMLAVLTNWPTITTQPDPRRWAIMVGIFAMRRHRHDERRRAARFHPLDFDLGRDDDRDHFEDLIDGDDLLRQRFGQGLTLGELAAIHGTTAARVRTRIGRRLDAIRKATR